eukprot:358996-Chlamydomonas_euryale.AAC.4
MALRCVRLVTNAQNAGALAAIVYDDVYESLIIMSMPDGHQEPQIPSVFVSFRSGSILTRLLTMTRGNVRVHITPVSAIAWLSALLSALLGLLMVAVVMASFYVMRSWGLWLSDLQVWQCACLRLMRPCATPVWVTTSFAFQKPAATGALAARSWGFWLEGRGNDTGQVGVAEVTLRAAGMLVTGCSCRMR